MLGLGLEVATHVLDEFAQQAGVSPVLLTFLPDSTRVWRPREQSVASGPSAF
jgi:hypothetical protein